jgi:mono/diheme cytochrome c family protein
MQVAPVLKPSSRLGRLLDAMSIDTSTFCLVVVGAVCATSGCSRDRTDEAARATNPPPATTELAPPPGPEAAAARAAGAPPSADTNAAAQSTTAAPVAATAGSGAQVFQTYCVTCHGAEGKGDGPAAASLEPKPASFASNAFRLDPNGNGKKGEVDDIKAVVRDGAAKYGGSPLMAPWAMLSAEQLQAVAQHVKSLGGS